MQSITRGSPLASSSAVPPSIMLLDVCRPCHDQRIVGMLCRADRRLNGLEGLHIEVGSQ